MSPKTLLFFACSIFWQTVFSQNFDSTLNRLAADYAPEKAYLHFDKPVYAPGDTIWFKIYVMENNIPAYVSKTIYADWTDDKGKVIYRSVLPLVDAMTNGQFDLPPDYAADFLHVRVYTRWMLNFDTSFLYNRDIPVIQTATGSNKTVKKTTPEYRLSFYPEGGYMVTGVNNRVVFKVNDQWGIPSTLKGVVKNNKGQVQDSLRALHDGMGNLFFQPAAGERFTAEWTDEKGGQHSTPLPEILPSGVGLQVTISGAKRFFKLSASPGGPSLVHLVGTMNQYKAFSITRDISGGPVTGTIPVNQLPSGILTLTVFDAGWKPLAERITFVDNGEYVFQPQMEVEHWGLNKRARNEISITIPDSMIANLSIAVTDADINTDSSDNIISHLLLTGDLKGYVHNPSFYFTGNPREKEQMVDMVMLTNGWRRIKWDDLVKGKLPLMLYDRDTSYLTLSGTVTGLFASQLREAGELYLIVEHKGSPPQMMGVPIDRNGRFNDPSLVLFDTATVFYQFAKKKEFGSASVQFMDNLLPVSSSTARARGFTGYQLQDTAGFSWQSQLAADNRRRRFNEMQTLSNITFKVKQKTQLEEMDDKYASGLFKFGDAYQFDLLNDPLAAGQLNIFNYLQGRVAGLQISQNGGQTNLSWRGGTPQLFVDEINTDASMVSSIPVTDVAYIKVFRPPFIGGFGGSPGGAIAIYTRKGGDQQSSDKGLPNARLTGYTISREFYSPNYDRFVKENEVPDNRTTLYWNPQLVMTPQNRKVTVRFYNNDVSRAFRVIIEGMTRDGRLAHVEQLME